MHGGARGFQGGGEVGTDERENRTNQGNKMMQEIRKPLYIKIPLTCGKVALIDPKDHDTVRKHKWQYTKSKGSTGYATTWVRREGRPQIIYMHRLIMSPDAGLVVDHKNGDGLDNRRQNLRVCSLGQNIMAANYKTNKTGFRGVIRRIEKRCINPLRNRWRAEIKLHQVVYRLGEFNSPEAAAHAYDQAAQHYFGEFARPNFPIYDPCKRHEA